MKKKRDGRRIVPNRRLSFDAVLMMVSVNSIDRLEAKITL